MRDQSRYQSIVTGNIKKHRKILQLVSNIFILYWSVDMDVIPPPNLSHSNCSDNDC